MTEPTKFAEVAWTTRDVQTLRPDWNDEKAEAFLYEAANQIASDMVERGWASLETLIEMEETC